MANLKCAFCGCEQTEEGQILKPGKETANADISELKAELKEVRAENKQMIDRLTKLGEKPPEKKRTMWGEEED